MEPQTLSLLEQAAVGGLRPDLTIILDLPPLVGMTRAAERRAATGLKADRFEAEDGGFHEGLRRAFLDIAEQEPERCCVIDAGQPVDDIARAIRQLVEARLLDAQAAAAQ